MRSAGFTLVEMVIVVVLLGALASVMTLILTGPLKASAQTERRARLVDVAETALGRMTRELRLALPNSIRIRSVGSSIGVEMLRTLDGGRYRAQQESHPPPFCESANELSGDPLEFNCLTPDDSFDVLGPLPRAAQVATGSAPDDCRNTPTDADCVVVFNAGPASAVDAYNGDNTATVTGITVAFDGISSNVSFARASSFPFPSPGQRFHVVDTPVSFVCDTAAGTVRRYEGYPIVPPPQPVPPVGGSNALLVNDVTSCSFSYDPGTATRGALVTLRLGVTEPSSGESVSLVQQAHVSNQP